MSSTLLCSFKLKEASLPDQSEKWPSGDVSTVSFEKGDWDRKK